MLIALLRKGPHGHHATVDLSIEQIVLCKFDQKLGLCQRVLSWFRGRLNMVWTAVLTSVVISHEVGFREVTWHV